MTLQVIGSSSAGNAYVLTASSGERLLVECGVRWSEILHTVDFQVSSVQGCLVSHEHGDHAKEVASCLRAGVDVYMSGGTADALGVSGGRVHRLQELTEVKVGSFAVRPFATKHDAAEPFGYLLHHPEMGVLVFATDTYYLPYRFAGLTHIMIECNYSEDILAANVQRGKVPRSVRNRILQSHLSLANCLRTLQANDLRGVNNIILLHLSESNSDAEAFRQAVVGQTGKNVTVAAKGIAVNLNKIPF